MGRKESNNIDFDFLIRNDGILRSFPLGFNQKVLAQLEGKRVSQYEWAWETSGLQKDLIYRERGERLTGVGLACFHLWVVDLDIKNGFDGVAEFKRIKGRNGLPRTWMASTPSGGRHIYFRRPSAARAATYGLGRQKEALLPGIDLRTGRSHVIFPGSRVDGVEYSWSSDSWSPKAIDVGRLPYPPGWLLKGLRQKKTKTKTKTKGVAPDPLKSDRNMTEDEAIDMAISEGDFDPSSPPGTRNSAMLKGFNRAAGIYRNATKLAPDPDSLSRRMNERMTCPLGEGELRTFIGGRQRYWERR